MPAGRPTKYDKTYLKTVKLLADLGATTEQIAEFLEVNPDTIYEWANKHPEFSETMRGAKSQVDEEVELALLKRAKGYLRTVERVGKDGEIIPCMEELPPEVNACKLWLINRQPKRWRDKQEVEHSGDLTVNLTLYTKTK